MVVQEPTEYLVHQDRSATKEIPAKKASLDCRELSAFVERRDPWVRQVSRDWLVPEDIQETPAHPVNLDQWDQLETPELQEAQDLLDTLVAPETTESLDYLAKMLATAVVLLEPQAARGERNHMTFTVKMKFSETFMHCLSSNTYESDQRL
ncbi:hypothetical protein ANCDUO_18612 [Ancylostoma duodenale]|uniref:Uncharacterized protein n=1 Tax=Ancylostoma duodenale TaxID=51022 RepID=A0A0C2C4T2_9BILA|nr:hypothetical protein ANCDUO_18612 [Ancylostoma duodenale]